MEHETFLTLLQDKAHWEFELFLIFLFDVVIGLILWPSIKKFIIHHKTDDERIAELESKVKELSK
ncbi:hypothetical protein KW807_01600 [Candidatus Parcubacteria bacterium]|nr:hypothetical protein [Candidatus Parcubacteria bacterium]